MEADAALVNKKIQPVKKKNKKLNKIIRQRYLYLLMLPALIWVILFCYAPMYGLYMAFINYIPGGDSFYKSFFTSQFVGLEWISKFFSTGDFVRIMRNTLCTSILTLVVSFPAPIILAILINEVKNIHFKKTIQTVSYLPYFISWVIAANIFLTLLSSGGFVNQILIHFGIIDKSIMFFQNGKLFWLLIAISNTWKGMGYNSIIYLSAIASISMEIYESADIDGATRFQKIIYITLPALMPTIVILLILSVGGIISAGFEQQLLMQNNTILDYSDVIDTYAYRYGIQNGMYSYGAAVGFFKSIVSFILVVAVNKLSRKVNDQALF
jgi:putative aldouronate transport system permease protein